MWIRFFGIKKKWWDVVDIHSMALKKRGTLWALGDIFLRFLKEDEELRRDFQFYWNNRSHQENLLIINWNTTVCLFFNQKNLTIPISLKTFIQTSFHFLENESEKHANEERNFKNSWSLKTSWKNFSEYFLILKKCLLIWKERIFLVESYSILSLSLERHLKLNESLLTNRIEKNGPHFSYSWKKKIVLKSSIKSLRLIPKDWKLFETLFASSSLNERIEKKNFHSRNFLRIFFSKNLKDEEYSEISLTEKTFLRNRKFYC